MRNGRLSIDQEQSALYLGWGIRFFLAAALAAAQLPDGSAPFAMTVWPLTRCMTV